MDPISKPAESFFVYDGDIVRLGEVQDLVCDIRVGLGGGGRGFEVFLLESLLGLAVAHGCPPVQPCLVQIVFRSSVQRMKNATAQTCQHSMFQPPKTRQWKEGFSLPRLQCPDERLLNTETTPDSRVRTWLGAFDVCVYPAAVENMLHGLGIRQTSLLSVSNKLHCGAMPGDRTMSAERPAPSASRPHFAHPMNLRRGVGPPHSSPHPDIVLHTSNVMIEKTKEYYQIQTRLVTNILD